MEGNTEGSSWLTRGLCWAPVIITMVYVHRRTFVRLWHGSVEQRDEKGRVIPARRARAAVASPTPPLPPSSSAAPSQQSSEEDEAQAEMYIIRRMIMRMARAGDVAGLLALLEDEERKKAQTSSGRVARTAEGKENAVQADRSTSTTAHSDLLNFIFGAHIPNAQRQAHAERRARRPPRQTSSTSEHEEAEETEAEPEEDHAEEGCSPLFVAALNGRAQMVRLLLERGALPALRSTREGVLPLYAACLEGHADVVWALLSDGAVDVNAVGVQADGSTPLMGCCEGGHADLVRLLIARGADVEARGRSGATALFYATQQEHCAVVRLLALKYRCNVNARKNDGSTALFLAIVSGRVDIVKILLSAGADVLVESTNGDSPLGIATKLRACFPAIYNALMDHEASS